MDGGNVELPHLLLEVVGHHRGHTGQTTGHCDQVQPGVADGGHFDVVDRGAMHDVEAEEGEEQVDLDPFGAGTVRHDQCRIDTFQ